MGRKSSKTVSQGQPAATFMNPKTFHLTSHRRSSIPHSYHFFFFFQNKC